MHSSPRAQDLIFDRDDDHGGDLFSRGPEPLALEVEGRVIVFQKEDLLKCYSHLPFTPSTLFWNERAIRNGFWFEGIRKIQVKEFTELLFPSHLLTLDVASTEAVKDSRYYLDNATFEVEDRLFMVPRHHFVKSTIFRLAAETRVSEDSEEDIIVLSDVLKVDFCALLKLIHSPTESSKLSSEEWESILKLSMKWQMSSFRQTAFDTLSAMAIPASEFVRLGREYGNPKWVLRGYLDLIKQKEALTIGEFRSMGTGSALTLSQNLRRRYRLHTSKRFLHDHKSNDTSLKQVVDDIFWEEIQLESISVDIIDRILQARAYGISEWVSEGYLGLTVRKDDITVEEAERLGLRATVRICQAREQVVGVQLEALPEMKLEKEVEALFAAELSDALQMDLKVYCGTLDEEKDDEEAGNSSGAPESSLDNTTSSSLTIASTQPETPCDHNDAQDCDGAGSSSNSKQGVAPSGGSAGKWRKKKK